MALVIAGAGLVSFAVAPPARAHAQGSTGARGAATRAPVPGAPAGVTAFVDVAVVPMDRARLLRHQTVLVQDGWITALGPSKQVRVPAGAVRIDGRGKFLIPGLADMHTHVGTFGDSLRREQALFLFAANGVTTIRDVGYGGRGRGSGSGVMARLAARAAAGALWSPRIYPSTGWRNFQQGTPPVTVADFVTLLSAYRAAGYAHVKLYGENADSLAVAARQIGLPIMGHVPQEGGLARAMALGYASVEHLTGFVGYLYSGQVQYAGNQALAWWDYWEDTTLAVRREVRTDSATLHALGTALRRAGVWNCPTLTLYAGLPRAGDPPGWHYLLADSSRQKYRAIAQQWADANSSPASVAARRATVEVRGAIVKGLQEAGAGLLLGTDPVGGPLHAPGFAVYSELEAFVRAGLTPYEALATGTRNVAEYFGTLDSTGTVAVGKRADLVLLAGNPLADIRHTAQPTGVMLGGRWLARADLDARLAALKGKLW